MLKQWEELPEYMQVEEVRPYWEALRKKRGQLAAKRVLDLIFALLLLLLLIIPMIVIALAVRLDSPGPAMYHPVRVTAYGKHFRMHKFRTMVTGAEKIGPAVTTGSDSRITRAGKVLRKIRLDELPQLFNVLRGEMSFVGTRPEAVKYTEAYCPEWNATLLLPAGITSECSIRYKDEARLLQDAGDADRIYMEEILPEKMKLNLSSVLHFSLGAEIRTVVRTVTSVFGKETA